MTGRVTYLGTVVANGGDAAIHLAQRAVMASALGSGPEGLHDGHPAVAARLFPGVAVRPSLYVSVNRPAGMGLPARVLRRLNKERMMLAARLWTGALGPLGRLLVGPDEAEGLRGLAGSQVVAYTGGTTLIEKYSVRGKLYEVELALAMGRPVVLLPQSLGPFRDAANQEAVRRVTGAAALVLLRDELSARHLTEIGCRTDNVRVVPDIVFALATQAGVERLARADVPARGARVAISVRDCTTFFDGTPEQRRAADAALRVAVAGLVDTLVRERDAQVTFISTCQGVPEYWTDDSRVARDVVDRLDPEVAARVVVDDAFHDTQELLGLLGGYDVAVCTRLHGAILALDAGTPVLPIAYEFKTQQVMGQLGIGEHVTDMRQATTASLVAAYDGLVTALPGLRAGLSASVDATARAAREVGSLVRDALRGRLS